MEQSRVVPALIASMEAAMERLLATKVPKKIVANTRYRTLLMQECKPGGPVVYDLPHGTLPLGVMSLRGLPIEFDPLEPDYKVVE